MVKRKMIAIDNGKKNLKAKCGDKEIIYANNYSIGHTPNLLGKNTYNITYKNKEYTIGENTNKSDKNIGKGSEIQIIQALTAITRFLDHNINERVCVVYGESVDKYFDNENKKNIKSLLEGRHIVIVEENDEVVTYTFTIEQVHILPEGTGELLSDFINKKNGTHYVVDIGGGTINFLTTDGCKPECDQSTSLPLGINNVIFKIIQNAKRKSIDGVEGQEKLIHEYLENREKCGSTKLDKIIEETIIEQFKEFDNKLAGYGINLHKLLEVQPVTFVGGGSQLFKKQIDKLYKCEVMTTSVVVENPVMSNVRGFYNYGLIKNLQE